MVVAAVKAKIVMVLIVALTMLICTMTQKMTIMKMARWTFSKKFFAV